MRPGLRRVLLLTSDKQRRTSRHLNTDQRREWLGDVGGSPHNGGGAVL
jgi:hypothetical protein